MIFNRIPWHEEMHVVCDHEDYMKRSVMNIFPPDTYEVGDYLFRLDLIPNEAIHPLTDAWDYVDCPVCDVTFYRLGIHNHLQTHVYKAPLWLKILKKLMGRV
jgi:hypothetical protein